MDSNGKRNFGLEQDFRPDGLVRATKAKLPRSDWQSRGQGFESHNLHDVVRNIGFSLFRGYFSFAVADRGYGRCSNPRVSAGPEQVTPFAPASVDGVLGQHVSHRPGSGGAGSSSMVKHWALHARVIKAMRGFSRDGTGATVAETGTRVLLSINRDKV